MTYFALILLRGLLWNWVLKNWQISISTLIFCKIHYFLCLIYWSSHFAKHLYSPKSKFSSESISVKKIGSTFFWGKQHFCGFLTFFGGSDIFWGVWYLLGVKQVFGCYQFLGPRNCLAPKTNLSLKRFRSKQLFGEFSVRKLKLLTSVKLSSLLNQWNHTSQSNCISKLGLSGGWVGFMTECGNKSVFL